MIKPKELLYFYRILNWKNKISGVRPIGYTIFGYLMARSFVFLPLFLNTIAIFGALIFCYTINDYFDWKLQKEKNFLVEKIEKKEINEKVILKYCFFPLIFLLPFLILSSNYPISFFILFAFFFISVFYSIPPLRFKKRKLLGVIIPPIGAPILFLQGYFILGTFKLSILFLAFLIFLFQVYLEFLHIIDDSQQKKEIKKMSLNFSQKALKVVPLFSLGFSLIFSLYNPIFLITAIFSIIRFLAVKKIEIKKINQVRKNLLSPVWSLYEFLIYGILGVLHLF